MKWLEMKIIVGVMEEHQEWITADGTHAVKMPRNEGSE
jgi:hypothetical protein